MTSPPATHPATHGAASGREPAAAPRSSTRTSDRGTDPRRTTPLAARRSAYAATLDRLRHTDAAAADAVGAHIARLRAEARQHREALRHVEHEHAAALHAVQETHADELARLHAALTAADRNRAYLQGRLDALEGRAATVDAATPTPTSTTKEHQ